MRKKYDIEKIKELYLSGKSLSEVAILVSATDDEIIRRILKRIGVPRRRRGAGDGEKNHQHKGGVWQRKDGYQVKRGTRAKPLEHREIAAAALGRPLDPGMTVHHINCIKSDNSNTNLLICSHAYHMALHARMRVHPYWKQFS